MISYKEKYIKYVNKINMLEEIINNNQIGGSTNKDFDKNGKERIITFYDKYNSDKLVNIMKYIQKYNLTVDDPHVSKQYDWLIKQKKNSHYRKSFNDKSWIKMAYKILTNPNYKPNIQKLNKAIEYIGDNGYINTLESEFPEQILCEKYILPDDCVLEIGSRYGTVSNIINIKLDNKTDQVSVDADLSIKKYHDFNKKQYVNAFIKDKDETNTYHSYFGMIDDSDTTFVLKKMSDTYGNNVSSLSSLKDDDVIIKENKHVKYGKIKYDTNKLKKYELKKIKYQDIQSKFNLSKPINTLVLDCEGCSLLIINQIIKEHKLKDIELILLEMDMTNLCDYEILDKILVENGFELHVGIWYNAVYARKSRINKYKNISKNYFSDEWWNGLIEIDSGIQISKKYNKK